MGLLVLHVAERADAANATAMLQDTNERHTTGAAKRALRGRSIIAQETTRRRPATLS